MAFYGARFGAMSQNIVVATAYATLGTDAVVHAVNEGGGFSPGSVDFSCEFVWK